MDDLLELAIRLLDPIVQYIGPHAVAAVAVMGAVVTYYNSRKQRRREKRLESKIDFILEMSGYRWQSAERSVLSANMGRNSSLLRWSGESLVRFVTWSIRLPRTAKSISLRRVESMSKTWLVGLLGYLAYFIKQFTGFEVPDEMINNIADLVLLVIPLVAMFANMKKGEKKVEKHHTDTGSAI